MGKVALGAVQALSIGLALSLAACNNPGSNASASRPYQSPDQYAGGTRGGGRQSAPSYEWMMEQEKQAADRKVADEEAARVQALDQAEALWRRAESQRDPDNAADDFKKIADDHKDSPRAEEARWREAQKRVEDRDWNAAVSALDAYTRDYPINPHLRDAERLLYESSVHVLQGARGFTGIFKSDKKGYEGLNAIVDRFPQGEYPDDALMALGEQYASKSEWADSALQYHNLLLRYPDSDLAPKARLRLGDAYLARDHGSEYHPGYVDVDPRVPSSPQAAATRPVKSCVEAALESYEEFLDRVAADPSCHGKYAEDIAYARQQQADCRQRLAAKSRNDAAFYARRGDAEAAQTYERFAMNEEAGRPWSADISTSLPSPAAPAQRPVLATAPDARPTVPSTTTVVPPTSSRVTTTPVYPPSTAARPVAPTFTPTTTPPTAFAPTSTTGPARASGSSSSAAWPPATIPSPSSASSSSSPAVSATSSSPAAGTGSPAASTLPPPTALRPGELPPPRRASRDGPAPR